VYCIPVPCESLEESSAKTLFLLGILGCRKDNGVYFALDTAKSKVLSKIVNIIGKAELELESRTAEMVCRCNQIAE
jgi:hypothetical protein